MSTKVKTLIIDDEKLARSLIKKYLENKNNIEIIGESENGFDGIKKINELKPDLVFLDIQMPKLNGFEMLELIEDPPVIIFSTAFDKYALKAFDVNATDYLLKPYSMDRFDEALSKAVSKIGEFSSAKKDAYEKLNEQYLHEIEYLDRIVIKNNQKISIVATEKVHLFEAQDDYVKLFTDDGNYLKQKTLKFFENQLDPKSFLRIHRSYIINLSSIKQIELAEKDTHKIILKNGMSVKASKTGYSKLKEVLS
ncbi:MAG: LytTR family transcriptional regulator DNA-binding domain-containing protein [Melioribacteraceae bacterium]|nr:LytTR family transcriptional regulator DNA-binding domain-containing protein [Melioribacteraceae bacterium]